MLSTLLEEMQQQSKKTKNSVMTAHLPQSVISETATHKPLKALFAQEKRDCRAAGENRVLHLPLRWSERSNPSTWNAVVPCAFVFPSCKLVLLTEEDGSMCFLLLISIICSLLFLEKNILNSFILDTLSRILHQTLENPVLKMSCPFHSKLLWITRL